MAIFPWTEKWRKQRKQKEAELVKAKEELDELVKSEKDETGTGAIDELEKAIADCQALELLSKSEGDEKDEKDEGEDEGEDEIEKAQREEAERLAAEEAERLEKSEGELDPALVAASEAFEALTKSVHERTDALNEGQEILAKSHASLLELNIKMAQSLIEMKKSLDEKLEALGKLPAASSSAMHLQFRKSQDEEGSDKTSVAEARDLLIKAHNDEGFEIPAGLLSKLDTTKNVGVIPEAIREKFNIKA